MSDEWKEVNTKRLAMLEAANRVALWVYWSNKLGTWDDMRTKVTPDLAEYGKAMGAWFDDHQTSVADVVRQATDAEDDDSELVSECCGSVGDEDVGICPVCKEHCEFVNPLADVAVPQDGKYTLEECLDMDAPTGTGR